MREAGPFGARSRAAAARSLGRAGATGRRARFSTAARPSHRQRGADRRRRQHGRSVSPDLLQRRRRLLRLDRHRWRRPVHARQGRHRSRRQRPGRPRRSGAGALGHHHQLRRQALRGPPERVRSQHRLALSRHQRQWHARLWRGRRLRRHHAGVRRAAVRARRRRSQRQARRGRARGAALDEQVPRDLREPRYPDHGEHGVSARRQLVVDAGQLHQRSARRLRRRAARDRRQHHLDGRRAAGRAALGGHGARR